MRERLLGQLALRHQVGGGGGLLLRRGGGGFVALAQGVRGAGAGVEVDGLFEQARDALHFELDGGGGDAPVVSAAHGEFIA